MGKFNVNSMRYLEPEHFRVLLAIEMGMKNHELVPLPLVSSVASIHRGATTRALSDLIKLSLVAYERGKRYDGYRLTNLGYDFLALRALCARDVVVAVGNQIGIGKESDVFIGGDPKMNDVVLKFHRLGRTCFRKLKEKRDYHQRRHFCSWLYLSRIAALKEFSFLKALHARGFPVPRPIDVCRHTVVMGLIDGLTLCHVDAVAEPGRLYDRLMQIIVRLAAHGVIHGDINEFNIILTKDEEPIIIDFPQMVSIKHENAEYYFDRDVSGVRNFFLRRFHFDGAHWPRFADVERRHNLDVELAASGFTKKMQLDLNRAYDDGNFDVHEKIVNDDENEEDAENDEVDKDSDESASECDEKKKNSQTPTTHSADEKEQQPELEEEEAEAMKERRRLRREERFNDWLTDAKSRLETLAVDELSEKCSQLVEIDAATSARYQEAYERTLIESEKYNREGESNFTSDEESKTNESAGKEENENASGRDGKKRNRRKANEPKRMLRAPSVYSNGSTITPDEIKRRLLREKGKAKKERLKAKGKQCAVSRGRRDNLYVIKEHQGWNCY